MCDHHRTLSESHINLGLPTMALYSCAVFSFLGTSFHLPAAAEVLGMSVRERGSCLSQKCSSPEQTDPGRRRLAGACTVSAYNLLREANPEPYPSEPEIKGLDL